MNTVHEPPRDLADPAELLLGYLDYYRAAVARKLDGLTTAQLRARPLPSGWTPLELLNHLVFMERRWLRWGFLAEPVADPLGDEDADGRWTLDENAPLADLVAAMHGGGRRTREIVRSARLDDVAPLGGRFAVGDKHPPPTLAWILGHVLQEYARHLGQLDAARELIDGTTGE